VSSGQILLILACPIDESEAFYGLLGLVFEYNLPVFPRWSYPSAFYREMRDHDTFGPDTVLSRFNSSLHATSPTKIAPQSPTAPTPSPSTLMKPDNVYFQVWTIVVVVVAAVLLIAPLIFDLLTPQRIGGQSELDRRLVDWAR
jgi:hypothetical protein